MGGSVGRAYIRQVVNIQDDLHLREGDSEGELEKFLANLSSVFVAKGDRILKHLEQDTKGLQQLLSQSLSSQQLAEPRIRTTATYPQSLGLIMSISKTHHNS